MSYQLLLRNLLSTFTDEAAAFTDVLLCLTYILRNQVMYKSGLHSNYLIIIFLLGLMGQLHNF